MSATRPLQHARRLAISLVAAASLFFATSAHPQGCSQCRDQIGQTPARTQNAYRRGILLLVGSAAGVFTAVLYTLKRYR